MRQQRVTSEPAARRRTPMAARHAAAMDHAAGARVTCGLRRSVARRRALLQHVALCCNMSRSVARRRSLLQDVALCCNASFSVARRRALFATSDRTDRRARGHDGAPPAAVPAAVEGRLPRGQGVGPVPAQMWDGQSWRRCGTASPDADVGRPVLAQMWDGQSWRRCGMASPGADVEPSLGADVAGVSPVLAQMWQG